VFLTYCVLFEAPPEVLISKQSRKLSAGANVTLTCPVRGSPEPTITWSRRDGQLPRSDWRTVCILNLASFIALIAFSLLVGYHHSIQSVKYLSVSYGFLGSLSAPLIPCPRSTFAHATLISTF